MMKKTTVQIGQTISLKIKRLGINGEGIGYFQQTIVFVTGALPGELILATVQKIQPRFIEASLTKIKQASPDRRTPPCPIYETCGGCQLQHLAYDAQLQFKQDLLKQALKKFKPNNYQHYPVYPTIGMPEPWHYRNKAQFQLGMKNGSIHAGLYQTNSHQLVPIQDCLVQHPATTRVINTVVALLNQYRVPIYNERKNTGIFRTLMVRVGIKTHEVQLVFITKTKQFPHQKELLTAILKQHPEIVSIVQNVQEKKTSLVMGETNKLLFGREAIQEQLNELIFDLSPRAFFQLNPSQTQVLYAQAIQALDLQPTDTVVDAYCGVGTIGLSIAKQVKEVRGMDIIAQSIADAQKNAQRLGVTNTHYEVGTAETIFPKWQKEGFVPDALIVDPPRTGLDPTFLRIIQQQPPQKMVYISCNVSTLAKDLVTLSSLYSVAYLQSIDMFPQTARCEVIVKLSRK